MINLFNLDSFSLFKQCKVFSIDKIQAQQEYIRLQKIYHPDNQTSGFSDEFLIKASAFINQAWVELNDEVLRVVLLLKLHGVNIDFTHQTNLPESFLLEQFHYHERLNDAQDANNLDDLFALEEEIKAKMQSLIAEFIEYFAVKDLDHAQKICVLLVYYKNFLKNINNILVELN